MDIEIKKPCEIITVKLKGEVYKRVYAVRNIDMVVKLVNDMFGDEIAIKIVKVYRRKCK